MPKVFSRLYPEVKLRYEHAARNFGETLTSITYQNQVHKKANDGIYQNS